MNTRFVRSLEFLPSVIGGGFVLWLLIFEVPWERVIPNSSTPAKNPVLTERSVSLFFAALHFSNIVNGQKVNCLLSEAVQSVRPKFPDEVGGTLQSFENKLSNKCAIYTLMEKVTRPIFDAHVVSRLTVTGFNLMILEPGEQMGEWREKQVGPFQNFIQCVCFRTAFMRMQSPVGACKAY